jgi:hypothetical protein
VVARATWQPVIYSLSADGSTSSVDEGTSQLSACVASSSSSQSSACPSLSSLSYHFVWGTNFPCLSKGVSFDFSTHSVVYFYKSLFLSVCGEDQSMTSTFKLKDKI